MLQINNSADISITSPTHPDPDPESYSLLRYHIIVRPVEIMSTTKGGIILPDTEKEIREYMTSIGRVLAIGPDAGLMKNGQKKELGYKVGDYVAFPRFLPNKLVIKGVKVVLMTDEDPFMVVKNPHDFDPNMRFREGIE